MSLGKILVSPSSCLAKSVRFLLGMGYEQDPPITQVNISEQDAVVSVISPRRDSFQRVKAQILKNWKHTV